jgi:gas vesicle protein
MANDRDRDSQAGTVVMAFIVGAIAGAAVALLWAPATGAETRRKLGDVAREGGEKAAEAARQSREFLKQQRDQISSAVDKGIEKGKDAYEKGKDAFEQARSQTRGSKESA